MAVLASRPVVRFIQEKHRRINNQLHADIFLFLSPPETHHESSVCPPVKPDQSEQPSIQVPHSMNYNTDCSNSSRLPLVDHTDQFHQTQLHPFKGSVAHTVSPTVTKIHTPIDLIAKYFHADSICHLLHPTGSRPCWIVWKTHSVQFHVLVLESSSDHHQSWST